MQKANDIDSEEDFVRQLTAHDVYVRAFIHAMVGDALAVDELAQETAVVLWRQRNKYDPSRPFAAWARGVARLVVLQWWRSQRRQGAVLSGESLEAVAQAFARYEDNESRHDQRIHALRACRDQLPPRQQRLLRQRYHDALPEADLAAQEGAGVHAVHKALVRIRARLRACIEQRLNREQI